MHGALDLANIAVVLLSWAVLLVYAPRVAALVAAGAFASAVLLASPPPTPPPTRIPPSSPVEEARWANDLLSFFWPSVKSLVMSRVLELSRGGGDGHPTFDVLEIDPGDPPQILAVLSRAADTTSCVLDVRFRWGSQSAVALRLHVNILRHLPSLPVRVSLHDVRVEAHVRVVFADSVCRVSFLGRPTFSFDLRAFSEHLHLLNIPSLRRIVDGLVDVLCVEPHIFPLSLSFPLPPLGGDGEGSVPQPPVQVTGEAGVQIPRVPPSPPSALPALPPPSLMPRRRVAGEGPFALFEREPSVGLSPRSPGDGGAAAGQGSGEGGPAPVRRPSAATVEETAAAEAVRAVVHGIVARVLGRGGLAGPAGHVPLRRPPSVVLLPPLPSPWIRGGGKGTEAIRLLPLLLGPSRRESHRPAPLHLTRPRRDDLLSLVGLEDFENDM
jgi:hypothetical protein